MLLFDVLPNPLFIFSNSYFLLKCLKSCPRTQMALGKNPTQQVSLSTDSFNLIVFMLTFV